jgi:hypothetical protein
VLVGATMESLQRSEAARGNAKKKARCRFGETVGYVLGPASCFINLEEQRSSHVQSIESVSVFQNHNLRSGAMFII